ncbi:MAG: class I SAM-dependent methyltransferase [Egibacteraceae bacterium]
MDHRDQPTPQRSPHPARRVATPPRFEWTRRTGIGPDLAVLGDLQDLTVVELGCGGGGNLAHVVARRGATGIGVDHDPAKISRARATYGTLPGIRFVLADAVDHLTWMAPGSVDVCMSIFGAFSFTDPLPLLSATSRALRPGGLLALTLRVDDHHDRVIVLRRR